MEGGSKGTGVRYADVAGVDHAMSIITETVEQLTGDTTYQQIGAKPARVINPSPLCEGSGCLVTSCADK